MPFNPWEGCAPCALDTAPCSLDNQRNMYSYESLPCNTPNVTQYPCNTSMSGNIAGRWTYQVWDYLLAMQGKLLPMYKTFQQTYSTISKFLFDYVTDIQDGKPMTKLAIKAIPQISLAPFLNGNFVTWGEYHFRPVDFVVASQADDFALTVAYASDPLTPLAQNTINGMGAVWADYSTWGAGFLSVWDTILIYQTCDPEDSQCDPCCSTIIQKQLLTLMLV